MFIAINKFTKWPEVAAVRKVTAQSGIKFLKELVCRFGVPARIITDNGTQFTSRAFMPSEARSHLPLSHIPGATSKLRG